jgi:superfamily I DNA/RNA helicase
MFESVFSNDLILRKARNMGCRPSWERRDRETEPGKPYDMVIVDEGQDLNEDLLWGLVTLLRNPNGPPPDLLVLGDKLQSIYGYRGSDFRYLDYASQAYPTTPARLWKSATLDTSFRLPLPSANFINAFAGEDIIKGFRPGPLPLYIVVDC